MLTDSILPVLLHWKHCAVRVQKIVHLQSKKCSENKRLTTACLSLAVVVQNFKLQAMNGNEVNRYDHSGQASVLQHWH